MALAWAWATRIIALSASMVIPALLGVWIDQKLGTTVVFMLIGFAFGITAAVVQLMRIVKESNSKSPKPPNEPPL